MLILLHYQILLLIYLKNVHQSSFSTLIKQILFKGQHDVVITKDAFVDITYLGTRLHHYDCLLEGKVCLSSLFYKNSNNYIQKIIGQLISNSSSVLNQCQGDELTIVYGSVLIQQIFEQNSITLQWTRNFLQSILNIIKTNKNQNLIKNIN
ncbi:unnamed protein product [Adineta steineri]|uniref:Transmembrane protein n=1 Tax=Adineta steineri TaxID=433720 RepID=A0A814UKP2_9BILA|nr:unnamed protein product [Adineta steineri]CAF3813034.1 unnamed protein product [Adineta steineri]